MILPNLEPGYEEAVRQMYRLNAQRDPAHTEQAMWDMHEKIRAAEAWAERATVFDFGLCPIHKRPILIEARGQTNGSCLWVVKMHEWVLGKDANWHWEPLPSSRTEEFISLTRFESAEVAHAFWSENVKTAQALFVGK